MALTQTERWRATKQSFNASSAAEGWLTFFAMAALIISVILVFWLSAKNRRSKDGFRHEIAGLTADIEELQQESAELSQHASAEASEEMPSEESEEPVAIQEG
ncbi:MAG: hypothetical protein ACYSUB_08175 [Planctomycetota bacterium]